jgi:tartrate dehydrogenase/decarboxylase / D-malate dehydrogenase
LDSCGSAFDIMGQGLANPVGTFWSCVMLLDHIGEPEAAARLMQAVETITADPKLHTKDLGGNARTEEVTNARLRTACPEWRGIVITGPDPCPG